MEKGKSRGRGKGKGKKPAVSNNGGNGGKSAAPASGKGANSTSQQQQSGASKAKGKKGGGRHRNRGGKEDAAAEVAPALDATATPGKHWRKAHTQSLQNYCFLFSSLFLSLHLFVRLDRHVWFLLRLHLQNPAMESR